MADFDYPEDSPGERMLFEENMELKEELEQERADCARERAARERAERERDVERHVRVTVEAELKGERKAHEETRKKLEVAEAFGDEMRAAESRLAAERAAHAETRRERDGYIRKLQETVAKVAENRLDGYRALGQRALDNELRAEAERLAHNDTKSRLAAAEECLREIERGWCANSRTIPDPSGTGTRTLWCPDLPRHRSDWCRGCIARAFLAGGKT